MEKTKMTKKEVFAYIANKMSEDEMVVNFCKHEIKLLENKASKNGQTKTQKANELIKTQILNALTNVGKAVTITELQAFDTTMDKYSNQKLSALLKQLTEVDKKVIKTVDKKKSYFSIKGE